MLGGAAREHLAGGDIERREHVERAVPHVVVCPPLGLAEIDRQHRLRALERLNLRLLVGGEHDGVGRRRHVEPDDITDFLDELRVGRELERFGAVRLQSEGAPDPADHRVTDAGRLRHRARAPMGLGGGVVSSVFTMMASTASSMMVRGAPTRGSSHNPASRRATNWLRHWPLSSWSCEGAAPPPYPTPRHRPGRSALGTRAPG